MPAFWQREARKVARRVNAARWLGAVLPVYAGSALVAGCAILFIRSTRGSIPTREILQLATLLAAPALLWSLVATLALLALPRFSQRRFTLADALVRLDITLGLHSRLESAATGVGRWPEPGDAEIDDGFRWRWGHLLGPLGASVAFLIATVLIPVTPRPARGPGAIEMPLTWAQVGETIETLREETLVAPETLDEYEEKLESLLKQGKEQWYQHSSLEAGATLRDELAAAAATLQRQLALASRAAEAHSERPMSPAERLDTLKGLGAAPLPLDPERLAALRRAAGEPASGDQLASMLRDNAEALQQALDALGTLPNLEESLGDAEGTGDAQDQPDGPGPGGNHAPLGKKESPVALVPETMESLPELPERFIPGETLTVTSGTHAVATDGAAPPHGGTTESHGQGGEAVWKEHLTPAEQALLQRVLK